MHAFVSIVIPVYNDQKGIESCLSAIAEQSWAKENLEVIVVDNGSNPKVALQDRYGFARVIVCHSPGSYAARNAGVHEARGEILAFTDADCVPDRNWISAGVSALRQSDGRCIIGGEVVLMESDHPTAVERYQVLVGFLQKENIHHRRFSATANLFVTREIFKRTGSFNETLLSGGDREWCWRAAKEGFGIEYSPETIVRTSPRRSFAAAIRQARRVTGGFYTLANEGWEPLAPRGLREHQSPLSMAKRILTQDELSVWNRSKVLAVASVIKITKLLEHLRLSFGARPERQ